jgi:type IV pilus assembly protein PilM
MAEEKLDKSIFGLDIGTYSIKAAEVKYHGDRAELYAASIIDMPESEKILTQKDKSGLVDCLKKAAAYSRPRAFDTKYVVSALPESKVYTDVLTMPKMTEEELFSAIPLEAAKHIPLDIKESYIDYSISEKTKDGKINILVVAASKKLVEFYIEIFRSAGMELLSLEIKPIAVARAILTEEMKKITVLILDIGANASSITVLHRGNFVVAITSSIGGEVYVKAIADELGVERAEALKMADLAAKSEENKNRILRVLYPSFEDITAKINKTIGFYQNKGSEKKRVEKILITGGGAITPGLKEYLKENTGVDTEIAYPLINVKGDMDKKISLSEASSIVTAIGLALKR